MFLSLVSLIWQRTCYCISYLKQFFFKSVIRLHVHALDRVSPLGLRSDSDDAWSLKVKYLTWHLHATLECYVWSTLAEDNVLPLLVNRTCDVLCIHLTFNLIIQLLNYKRTLTLNYALDMSTCSRIDFHTSDIILYF